MSTDEDLTPGCPPGFLVLSSPDGVVRAFACDRCGRPFALDLNMEYIGTCCRCRDCGADVGRLSLGLRCTACERAASAVRIAAQAEAEKHLPFVDGHTGPVFTDRASPSWFADVDEAAEAVWDQCHDPDTFVMANVIAHPCTVSKASTPDLLDLVQTGWDEQFTDGFEDGPPAELERRLIALQKDLEAAAPTIWHPDTSTRVLLPDYPTKDDER